MLGISAMPKYRSNLEALVLQKSADQGKRITQKEVAEATGLSLPTIQRWYHSKVDRLDLPTVSALIAYLGCTFGELVEYVDEE